jgi:pSer/pThr/pTyr-binding forkhead associated (FHA) protein
MNACPVCGQKYHEGLRFCEFCGHDLYGTVADETIPTINLPLISGKASTSLIVGTARFTAGSTLLIYIQDVSEPIVIPPVQHLVLGRFAPGSLQKPDLDLAPYYATEKGVSRLHAAIDFLDDTLTLTDLGSTNGTYLNGRQLAGHDPKVLHDADEILLGRLVTQIYFQ